jgi:carboxynorspermidine decarboxylase
MSLQTPYYLIDEKKLLKNLKIIERVRRDSGAKSVLALKCFSTWSVFDLMKRYMDGTTSSSVYEARLGHEKFGKETHAYAVAYTPQEVREAGSFADKIIFNSLGQCLRLAPLARRCKIGLRVNPGVSYSCFDLADPARRFSRLGVADKKALKKVLGLISGVMFHFNCENDDFANFAFHLDYLGRTYGALLRRLEWVSLGGGLSFTKKGYPLDKFCGTLKEFSDRFGVQVYLEPGESVITQSAELVTRVLDIVRNRKDIAIVDASTEAHMLDLLIYRTSAKIKGAGRGRFSYLIAGRSCLAGDIFGTARFTSRLKVGSMVRFSDAAGYTMVKKNWFNGLPMPSIAVKRLDGSIDLVRRFTYKDFVSSLS